MHEVSVMSGIIEAVMAELAKHDVEKVEEVLLVLGELTYLGKDQLQFAYEIMTRETILEGSVLVFEDEKAEISCPTCGYQGKAEYYGDGSVHENVPKLSCPTCGSGVKVLKGKSCRISSLKVVER
jgi:hydrogenase nickel incorporation protein HypA/HybF